MSAACLGLSWLGDCSYDPSAPGNLYFSLGEAVGALAFTLAVQQFLRPIYLFRLRSRYLSLGWLYSLVFAGVGSAFVAAIVPSLNLPRGWWVYPVVWELLAAILFVVPYGAVGLAIARPIKVAPRRIPDFARGAARLLAGSSDSDRIDLMHDLILSVPILAKAAHGLDTPPKRRTAFYDYIHRSKIEQAGFSQSFLSILADPQTCRTLVRSAPWSVAEILRGLSDEEIYAPAAEQWVREIAKQAILEDESMMAREIEFHGFATAPLLSDGLFSDAFIVERYNPMDFFLPQERIGASVLRRFNHAARRSFMVLIDEGSADNSPVAHWIASTYETAFLGVWKEQERADHDHHYTLEVRHSLEQAARLATKMMDKATPEEYEEMFISDPEKFRSDGLEALVEIVFKGLCSFASKFAGVDDPFWMAALEGVNRPFEKIGAQPDGMTPFQQRLALKIVDKVKDNMEGWYPSITRVLLATLGPYNARGLQPNRTAFNILREAVYAELRLFPKLAEKQPEKVAHYLPHNITFDGKVVVHLNRDAAYGSTDLTALTIERPSLTAPEIRRPLTAEERREARARIF